MVKLKDDPDWIGAGETFVSALASQNDDSARLSVLLDVCKKFDGALYPAFLKVLCAVGRFGTDEACTVVAQTLAVALKRTRLPSGQLSAWGLNASAGRSVGPVEYLCVQCCEAQGAGKIDDPAFVKAMLYLTRLFRAHPETLRLYQEKLRQDAANSLEGTYSRAARTLLTALADCWDGPADEAAIAACLRSPSGGGMLSADRARWGL
ncbi:MAG: hypothetical protein AAGK23_09175 [Pseudomonadota bacterium]